MRYTIPTIFLLVRHGAAGVITHGTTGIPLSAIAYAKRGPANLEQTDAIQPPSLATDINTGPIYTCNCMNDDITANHQSTRRCCVEGYINVRDVRLSPFPFIHA